MKENNKNKFEQKQPLRHKMSVVAQNGDQLRINKQTYKILVNYRQAIDLSMLAQKYDPYLDQYDYLVGDISSEHLRLKGFYKDNVRTAIDRKEKAIADYLIEYCNPGGAYFVLKLQSPVHHYSSKNNDLHSKKYYRRSKYSRRSNFAKKRVHKTKFSKKATATIQRSRNHRHGFVIKKRKGQ